MRDPPFAGAASAESLHHRAEPLDRGLDRFAEEHLLEDETVEHGEDRMR
jgi:hypothetical protein